MRLLRSHQVPLPRRLPGQAEGKLRCNDVVRTITATLSMWSATDRDGGSRPTAVNWLAASSGADVPSIDWGHLKIRCINLGSNDHTTRAGSPTRPHTRRPGQASTARG